MLHVMLGMVSHQIKNAICKEYSLSFTEDVRQTYKQPENKKLCLSEARGKTAKVLWGVEVGRDW